MIQETYEHLRKEHPVLPEFDKINKEFELLLIENEAFLLRATKRKIAEKLETCLHVMEHAFSPDPGSFTDMYECRSITHGEKKQLLEILKQFMEHYRLLLETDILVEDKTDAETIRKVYDMWMTQKKQLLPFVKKIRESWTKNIPPDEIQEYLG